MRAHRLLTTAASLLIVLLPMQAFAQEGPNNYDRQSNVSVRDRPRPDYDPIGVKLGGFDLQGSLEGDAESNDNVFATESNADSDTILYSSEAASLASHWSRHSLSFGAGGTQSHHNDFNRDDTNDDYLRADGRLDIYRSTDAGAGVSMNDEHEARTDPDSPNNLAEPIQYSRDEQYAYIRHAFNRFRFTGRVTHSKWDYQDAPLNGGGTLDQDFRDHDENSADARVEVALTPRVAFLVDANLNNRDYSGTGPLSLDSFGRTYSVGINFDLTNLVRGEFTIGTFDQDYKNPALGKVDGTAYAAHVDWFPTQLTTVAFDVHRGVEESAIPGASILHTEEGVRIDHELLRNVILTAGVRQAQRDYTGVARTDDTTSGDIGADYLVNRRVRLHAGYSFDHNSSNIPGEDFDVNRFSVGVSFHL